MQHSEKSKRIAKNTGAIYIRMTVIMLATLYTSRIVLQQLGVIDFGIYNVVAGVVALLTFCTSSLANASQRYMSIGLGENDTVKTKLYFQQSLSLMTVFSVFILVMAESIGLWIVSTQLSIPSTRIGAAAWAYQFAVVSAVCSVIQVPFMAEIIVNEKMKMYAHIGLFEAFARLAIAYLLAISSGDKLIVYSALYAGVSICTLAYYIIYDRITFAECRFGWVWCHKLVHEMLRFIGYTVLGSLAWRATYQGTNVILNIFFGPAINTARGIALQVSTVIDRFSSSMMTAAAPQIIKSYAERDIAYMTSVIEKASKFSFFLSCAISMPIIWETRYILHIWLGDVPDYTVIFTRLLVIDSLVNIFFQPLATAANATARIKGIQFYGRLITLSALPVGYLVLYLFHNPILAICVILATDILYWGYCLIDIHHQIQLGIIHYLRHSVCPAFILFASSLTACWTVHTYACNSGFPSLILITLTAATSCIGIGYLLITKTERAYIWALIKRI